MITDGIPVEKHNVCGCPINGGHDQTTETDSLALAGCLTLF